MADDLLVACFCAAWCGACRTFVAEFDAVARAWPAARFVWVDIEDHPDVLGDDVDIETFPTVLIAGAGGVSFYGVIEPRRSTLQSLIVQANDDVTAGSTSLASVSDVERRVRLHAAAGSTAG